ncbi:MAG: NYN domain-containing protein [Deltaproteobacteria bacterium]|nr:MAG: NYN domain-containing protein [Deltaproteobacteria bacterium]
MLTALPSCAAVSVRLREAYALIDWDSARRCPWLDPIARERVHRQGVAAQVDAVLKVLAKGFTKHSKDRVRVNVRVYHGWHRGNEPTQDLRDLTGLRLRKSSYEAGRVLVTPPVVGDRLACGGPRALLRDTLRIRDDDGRPEQKMVDSAIAADLLHLARRSAGARVTEFIVFGEDDDLIPPVVVANHWGLTCRIMRTRASNRCMRHTADLLIPCD